MPILIICTDDLNEIIHLDTGLIDIYNIIMYIHSTWSLNDIYNTELNN